MRILLKISFFTKRKARREGQTAFFKERTQLASVRTKPTLFTKWERFLKTTASLSNLIPPCFYDLTNLVSVSYAPAFLMPGLW
jgi:hypothetical protein